MKRTNQRLAKGSFALLMVAGTAMGLAQKPHTIQVQVNGLNQDTVYLANYYGNKLYYSDTTVTDAEGRLTFPGRPYDCLLYTSPSPRDGLLSRMPSSA